MGAVQPIMNNRKWVEENPVPSHSVDAAARYIFKHHPYFGCAFSPLFPPPEFKGDESTELLADHADAVTIACGRIMSLPESYDVRDLNQTTVGNLAYLSIHGSEKTKLHAAQILQRWRELNCPTSRQSV